MKDTFEKINSGVIRFLGFVLAVLILYVVTYVITNTYKEPVVVGRIFQGSGGNYYLERLKTRKVNLTAYSGLIGNKMCLLVEIGSPEELKMLEKWNKYKHLDPQYFTNMVFKTTMIPISLGDGRFWDPRLRKELTGTPGYYFAAIELGSVGN